jgi:hypothetical protein
LDRVWSLSVSEQHDDLNNGSDETTDTVQNSSNNSNETKTKTTLLLMTLGMTT